MEPKANTVSTGKQTHHGIASKKRRGALQMLMVALFMIRRRSGKSKPVDATSRGMWNRLVGSMRPLHLQGNESPSTKEPAHTRSFSQKGYDVVFHQQTSPTASSFSSTSFYEDGMSSRHASAGNLQELDTESRYASATNLQELDESEENEIEYVENGGDEMIDVKADEFIAQFYQQMRLQRLNSIDRRYNEMMQRSIS